MGYGCYFTNKESGTKSFWIDVETGYEDEHGNFYADEWAMDDELLNVQTELENMGYNMETSYHFWNGLYDLFLEFGPEGDMIIFRLEPLEDCEQGTYNLAMANFERNYDAIAKRLIKAGYELRVATSGYTSGTYKP